MKLLTRLALIGTLSLLTTCSFAQTTTDSIFYRIIIEDYYGASGHGIIYNVTNDSLKVITDCDFVGCEKKVIYEQGLADNASIRFSKFISQLRIDTLRDRYETRGLDGLVRLVTFQKDLRKIKYILLERYHHPAIDSLVFEIKNLITNEIFREMK